MKLADDAEEERAKRMADAIIYLLRNEDRGVALAALTAALTTLFTSAGRDLSSVMIMVDIAAATIKVGVADHFADMALRETESQ